MDAQLIYKGFTVNFKKRQFEKMDKDWKGDLTVETWIPFDTELGKDLIARMIKRKLITEDDLKEVK